MSKQVFLSVSLDTGRAVTNVTELKALIKNLKKEIENKSKSALDVDVEPLKAKLRLAQKELQTFNDSIRTTPSFVQRLTSAFEDSFLKIGGILASVFAVEKAIEFGKASVEAFSEQQKAEKELLTALNGRSDVQQRLIKQASELQDKLKIPDEAIISAQAFLAAQGRSEEQIRKTIEAATELSAVTGDDLDTAVKKLDKTFEGQVGRLGNLDKDFTKLSKSQLENGGAIDVILNKYKGFAEQVQNTPTGKLQSLRVQFDELKESVGEKLVAGLVKLQPVLSSIITGFGTFINVIIGLPKFISQNKDLFIGLGTALMAFNAQQILASANALRLAAAQRIQQASTIASTIATQGLNAAMKSNPIGFIIGLVASLVTGFIALYKNSETVRVAISGLFSAIKTAFVGIKDLAVTYLTSVGDLLLGIFTFDIDKIKSGASKLINGFKQYGENIATSFRDGALNKIKEEKLNEEIEKAVGKPEIDISIVTDKKQLDEKRKEIQSQLNRINALISKVDVSSDFGKQLSDKKKELEGKLSALKVTPSLGGNVSAPEGNDDELKKKLEKELEVFKNNEKAKVLETQKGSLLRAETELKSIEDTYQKQRLFIEKTVKDEADRNAQLRLLSAQRKEDEESKEEEIRNIKVKLNEEVTSSEINRSSTKARFDIQVQGLERERDILLSNTNLSEAQRLAIIKKYQEKINKVRADEVGSKAAIVESEIKSQIATTEQKLSFVKKGTQEEYELKKTLVNQQTDLAVAQNQKEINLLLKKKESGEALTDEELAKYKFLQDEKTRLTSEGQAQLTDLGEQFVESQKAQIEDVLNKISSTFSSVFGSLNSYLSSVEQGRIDAIKDQLDKELERLDAQEKAEEKAGGDVDKIREKYDKKKKAAQEKARNEEAAIKQEQFRRQKLASFIESIINTAVAVTKAMPNVPLMVLAAVTGSIQSSLIAAQPSPKFAKGNVFSRFFGKLARGNVFGGSKHSDGGNRIIDSQTGDVLGEIERDETLLTAGVAKNPQLLAAASRLNVIAGGKSLTNVSVNKETQKAVFGETNSKFAMGTIWKAPNVYQSDSVFTSSPAVSANINSSVELDSTKLTEYLDKQSDTLQAKFDKPFKGYVLQNEISEAIDKNIKVKSRSELAA